MAMVGREAEWSVVEAFLERATEGPRALVLEGAAEEQTMIDSLKANP